MINPPEKKLEPCNHTNNQIIVLD